MRRAQIVEGIASLLSSQVRPEKGVRNSPAHKPGTRSFALGVAMPKPRPHTNQIWRPGG